MLKSVVDTEAHNKEEMIELRGDRKFEIFLYGQQHNSELSDRSECKNVIIYD